MLFQVELEGSLPARTAVTDTPSSLNDGMDDHEMESPTTVYMVETIPQHLEKTSSNQKADQRSDSEGAESYDTIKMDDPGAMRTRRRTKLQHPSINAKRAKKISGKSTNMEEESLLSKLIQQTKQQQDRLTEMNVMLKKVLELQMSMVCAMHKDIEAVSKDSEKLPLPGPIIMVKQQKATNERKAYASKRLISASENRECGQRSNHTIKMQSSTSSSVIAPTDSVDRECGTRINPSIKMPSSTSSSVIAPNDSDDRCCGPSRIYGNNASVKSGINESTCDRVEHKNIRTMLPTSALDDSNASSCDYARVFMAKSTPRKEKTHVSVSLDDSYIYELPRHSDVSDGSQIYDTSPDSLESEASPTPVKSTRSKKRFIFPKPSEKDKAEAYRRLDEAMLKVPDKVHFDKTGNRKSATLYMGNLEFNASDDDIWHALHKEFHKVLVEDVTIPRINGKSKGYGFVKISWAHNAPISIKDTCIYRTGNVIINSRPVYFRELYDEVGTEPQSMETVQATHPSVSTAKAFSATTISQIQQLSRGYYMYCGC